MQIYAHRGASQTHSENTIGAFAEAVRLGVHGIELDIHATSDGIPVVIHDSSLSRTMAKEAEVTDLTFEHLRSMAPTVPAKPISLPKPDHTKSDASSTRPISAAPSRAG